MIARIFILLIVLGILSGGAFAQNTTGSLEGHIVNVDGTPLLDVNVTVTGDDLQGRRGAATNERGFFHVIALPTGEYEVKVSHIGHQEVIYQNVRVILGKTTTLGEIILKTRLIEMPVLVVTENRPIIDPASTTVGANLSPDDFETLPVGRNYRDISVIIPQANLSYFGDEVNISGSTGGENKYFLDGANVTESFFGETGTNLPYNFIKEIEFKTGAYQAEYGGALGGVINVITYSGGNEFTGNAFGFFINDRLRGDPTLLAGQRDIQGFMQRDAGFSLGGPLVQDKLWFYAAYNHVLEKKDIEVSGLGFHEDRQSNHNFAGKLTWQAGNNTNVALSVFGDPSTHRLVGHFFGNGNELVESLDSYLARIDRGGINASLLARHFVNQNFQFEGMLSRTEHERNHRAETDQGRMLPRQVDRETGIWSGGYGFRFAPASGVRTQAKLSGTLFIGKHQLKGGVEYQNIAGQTVVENRTVNRFGDSIYNSVVFNQSAELRNRIPSVFLQDSWSTTSRLRLNYGVRWSAQFWTLTNGDRNAEIKDQFQPRLGFVYQPGELGSQRIVGSYGRFYEELPLEPLRVAFGDINVSVVGFDHDPILNPAGGDTVFSISSNGDAIVDDDIEGQYIDEFTLGYERRMGQRLKLGIRGIYRNLGQVLENGRDPTTQSFWGNPGRGLLSFLPKFKREYISLEFTIEKFRSRTFNFLASYVLSRNYGNYPGLIGDASNYSSNLDFVEQIPNQTGLLPNDRTHVFKFSGSYRFQFGLTFGTLVSLQSGTPISELGSTPMGAPWFIFLSERGSVRRTPAIFNIDLRLTYKPTRIANSRFNYKIILDMMNLTNEKTAVTFEEIHFFRVDENGNQASPNPNFGKPASYRAPLTVRLGFEVGFD